MGQIRVGLEVSRMHKFSKTRGIGVYAQNLYNSIKESGDVEIQLIEGESDYKQFDLIHFPFFDLFRHTLPLRISKPLVITIPDLIPLQFPNHYPPGLKGRASLWLQKKALRNAKAIIGISKTVKRDIEKILKISPDKVFSTYLAPSKDYKKIIDQSLLLGVKKKYALPEEFVLYVGNVNWNKNILNMTEACMIAGKTLVIVGSSFLDKGNLNHPEKKSFKEFLEKYEGNKLIRILGFVEDEDLVKIMNLATVLLFVSLYEGFGLPVLEAQACGLSVITSKTSALGEIAKKGAILVTPESVEEITGAIKRIFSSKDFRKKLIEEGQENLKDFSWEKTAKETVEIYEKVLKIGEDEKINS